MKKFAPTKEEIALLGPFVGLELAHIHVPTRKEEFASASAEIVAAGIAGFDTESRPTFVVGDVSEGPHVVQFALHDKAFLFQLHHAEGMPFLLDLLQSEQLIKVGFGLKSDRKHIRAKLGVHFNSVVDLNTVFSMDEFWMMFNIDAFRNKVFFTNGGQVVNGNRVDTFLSWDNARNSIALEYDSHGVQTSYPSAPYRFQDIYNSNDNNRAFYQDMLKAFLTAYNPHILRYGQF